MKKIDFIDYCTLHAATIFVQMCINGVWTNTTLSAISYTQAMEIIDKWYVEKQIPFKLSVPE